MPAKLARRVRMLSTGHGRKTDHRDDLVRNRTQTVNRLHALLAKLVPAGLPRGLTAR